MKVTSHTYQMSRSISVNCHGSCPLLCGCHGYLACCRSPWWQAGCLPIGWKQFWARRITVQSLAKAPGGRRNTCAQRSLLDFGRWPQKVGSSKRRRWRAQREELKDIFTHPGAGVEIKIDLVKRVDTLLQLKVVSYRSTARAFVSPK